MANIEIVPPQKEIEGVKYEVALQLMKMVENGTRYFGSSGASLTHQVSNPDYINKGIDSTLAKIGLEGEREDTEILKKWMADKPNVILVDSVHIRGYGKEEIDEETGIIEGGDTDHILIIGKEVVLIDTKRWRKKSAYEVADNGEVLRSKKSFPGGNVHMKQAVQMWVDYLEAGTLITGIVHINAEDAIVFRNKNWYRKNYRLVELNRFTELLDEKWNVISDYNKSHIDMTIVSQIALNAVKPYDDRSSVFNMDSIADFR